MKRKHLKYIVIILMLEIDSSSSFEYDLQQKIVTISTQISIKQN